MAGDPARADPPITNPPDVEAAFQAAPSEMIAEILDGELHLMPRPRPLHARTSSKLGAQLDGPFDAGEGGPGGWVILDEPELHLGPKPDKIVPDLAGWRRERLPPNVFDEDAPGHIAVPPDWLCEVLSSGTEATDRGKKLRIYRRERVGHVWLVNPTLRTLEVYRLEGDHWVLLDTFEGDTKIRPEPFSAVELDLGTLWVR
jgi:Uma2 family endonuclease